MNVLMMPSFVKPHNQSVHIFMENKIIPLLGEPVKNSFIYLPKLSLNRPCHYNIKLAPNIESGFKFLVGVSFMKLESRMYIAINQEDQIDSFSYNWNKLFVNPQEFLTQGESLEKFCP